MSQGIPRIAVTSQAANISGNQANTSVAVQSDTFRPDMSTFNNAISQSMSATQQNANRVNEALASVPPNLLKSRELDLAEREACRKAQENDLAAKAKEAEGISKDAHAQWKRLKEFKLTNQEAYENLGKEGRANFDSQLMQYETAGALSIDEKDRKYFTDLETSSDAKYTEYLIAQSGIGTRLTAAINLGALPEFAIETILSGKDLAKKGTEWIVVDAASDIESQNKHIQMMARFQQKPSYLANATKTLRDIATNSLATEGKVLTNADQTTKNKIQDKYGMGKAYSEIAAIGVNIDKTNQEIKESPIKLAIDSENAQSARMNAHSSQLNAETNAQEKLNPRPPRLSATDIHNTIIQTRPAQASNLEMAFKTMNGNRSPKVFLNNPAKNLDQALSNDPNNKNLTQAQRESLVPLQSIIDEAMFVEMANPKNQTPTDAKNAVIKKLTGKNPDDIISFGKLNDTKGDDKKNLLYLLGGLDKSITRNLDEYRFNMLGLHNNYNQN